MKKIELYNIEKLLPALNDQRRKLGSVKVEDAITDIEEGLGTLGRRGGSCSCSWYWTEDSFFERLYRDIKAKK